MTTPETTDVREWARQHGFAVAERGRLPAEVLEAYAAAGGSSAPAKKAGAAKKAGRAPVKKAAKKAGTRKAPAQKPGRVEAAAQPLEPLEPDAGAVGAPEPRETAVDDRRLVALAEQVAVLSERVAKLEAAQSARPKASLFRRSR